MLTQQDIYAVCFENRPLMLNKDNYVPWSSRLLHYAKSKPNGKLIYNSIMNGPYVKRMIPEPSDPDHKVPVAETFYEQTDDELTEKEVIQMEAVQNPGVQNVRNQNGLIVVLVIANQNGNGNVVAARAEGNAIGNNGNHIWCYNCRGLGHLARNCTVRLRRRDAAYLQTQSLIAGKDNKERDKIKKTGQNQEKTGSVEKSRLKPDKVKAQSNSRKHQIIPSFDSILRASVSWKTTRQRNGSIAQKEEAGIQLQAEEFDLMAAVGDLDKIEEVNANYILMANL
uniref:CCHC-type domain-containing protein n=1 Tax=Tanacetum cinerariifolium TaxID=118510 RepID=A0A6L2JW58_TANCI|nr:hypothetical protein [Tanacetum cinerariifolium]